MRRILHITHTDIRSDSRILKEICSLSDAGYEVSSLGVTMCEEAPRSDFSPSLKIFQIKLASRRFTFLPRSLMHVFSLCELVAKMLLSAIRQKPDLIHCHDVLVLPLGVIVKLITRAKLVYDAHELESNRNGLSKFDGFLTLHFERILWKFVDALIVVSPSVDAWYQNKIGPKLSSVVLNSPLISKKTPCERDYLRKRFLIPPSRKIFIYVGGLTPGRGIELITQTFIHHSITSHLVFLGYGDWADNLKQLAMRHLNIHVHDAVPHADVVPIVQSADFGLCMIENVSLSDYYCLPNKIFEYCFAGIPVLASDFPDIRAVLSKYGIGTCSSLNPKAFHEAVHLLETSNEKFEFTDLTPLSWQEQERKLIGLYKGLLENSTTK